MATMTIDSTNSMRRVGTLAPTVAGRKLRVFYTEPDGLGVCASLLHAKSVDVSGARYRVALKHSRQVTDALRQFARCIH
jgi:hypothetical protein